ncbi:hypothetical protein BJ170DRAFT_144751 [Xylariales sp. AK1849]|nr:hypothetical protein BJ170DRAFT_144751 [Xylariales sp. AK1849]
MAVRPGEENVATLFGDIHYFYGPPTANPPHHRFDKGSYVYLFENANNRRARIEVANQPGTDVQDAFDGFLDKTRVRYSYNRQCLVSITVDDVPGPPGDQSDWHLPTYDPRNENKYHYKLHSLDIYFWTQTDALQFVDGVRRVLPPAQVEVLDEPGPPAHSPRGHFQDINPLVQKLEKAAISNPPYGTPLSAQQGVPTFAPPPISAVHGASEPPANFAPMAYNPAAPAAPEQIRHREKTPPPPEDDGIDPLRQAVAVDHAPPRTPGFGPMSPAFPGSPGHPGVTTPGFPPSQFGHLQRSATMPVTGMASPGFPPQGLVSPGFPPQGLASPGLASPYGSQFPGTPGFAPPPQPNTQISTHSHATPPPPSQSAYSIPQSVQSPGLPPGGYSNYNYSNPSIHSGVGVSQQGDYSIHQQVYRPTNGEHAVKYKPTGEGRGKMGQNADRLERGVTGMLKKFEKKFG